MAERPTPHSICVCTLIALFSDKSSPIYSIGDVEAEEIDGHLSSVLEYLVVSNPEGWSSASSSQMMSLEDLTRMHLWNKDDDDDDDEWKKAMVDVWIQDLYQSASSLDSFMDLFAALRSTVSNGIIDGESAQGIYIRQRCLGFDELPFEAVSRLWTCFRHHVHPSATATATATASSASLSLSLSWPCSPKQVQRELHRDAPPSNDWLEECVELYPEIPACHYHLFLHSINNRKDGEDHLHRYFDYAMIQERKDRLAGKAAPASTNTNILPYASIVLAYSYFRQNNTAMAQQAIQEAIRVAQQSNDDTCLAFALSYLHYFTTPNTNTNMNTATDCSTHHTNSTSNHSSSLEGREWLLHQAAQHANAPLLERAALQGIQWNIPSLVHATCLNLSQQAAVATNPPSSSQSRVLHPVYPAASHVAFQSLAAATVIPSTTSSTEEDDNSILLLQNYPTQTNHHNHTHANSFLDPSKDLAIGLYDNLGHANVSSFCASFLAPMSSSNSDYHQLKQAKGIFYGSASHRLLNNNNNQQLNLQQSLKQTLRLLPSHLTQPKQYHTPDKSTNTFSSSFSSSTHAVISLSRQSCHYDKCISQLLQPPQSTQDHTNIKKNNNNRISKNHAITSLQLEWALNRLEWNTAHYHHFHLHSYHPSSSSLLLFQQTQNHDTMDWNTTSSILQTWCYTAKYMAKSGHVENAIDILRRIGSTVLKLFPSSHSQLYVDYTLELVALLLLKVSSTTATLAVEPLLKCLHICELHSMHTKHACALCLLGNVHYQLGNISQAKHILQSALPSLIQNAHVWYQGIAYVFLAKCFLYSDDGNKSSENYPNFLMECISHLKKAQDFFERLQEFDQLQEIFYLQAQCYQSLLLSSSPSSRSSRSNNNYKMMRNTAAKNFRLLQKHSIEAKYQMTL